MNQKVTLGYWGIRGRGQIPRLLLAYTGAIWEDQKYTDGSQWFGKDKQGLGLLFPNLPYLIDGDFKVTETTAVIHHIIARSDKKQLLGKNEKDQVRVTMLSSVIEDIFAKLRPLCFNPQWEKVKDEEFGKFQHKLAELDKFVGNNDTALGYLTVLDFIIAELSYFVQRIYPEQFKKYEFLIRIRKALESLPAIKQYYEQPASVKGPFMPQSASIKF